MTMIAIYCLIHRLILTIHGEGWFDWWQDFWRRRGCQDPENPMKSLLQPLVQRKDVKIGKTIHSEI